MAFTTLLDIINEDNIGLIWKKLMTKQKKLSIIFGQIKYFFVNLQK